jgi:hypothetical protein
MKKKNFILILVVLMLLAIGVLVIFREHIFRASYEVTDELGGNIFPSVILAVANTDTIIVKPANPHYEGNPKGGFMVKIKSSAPNSRVRITIAKTPFFDQSTTEFTLSKADSTYQLFPNVIWDYQALKDNSQPTPVSVSFSVTMNGKNLRNTVQTYSMRSINECLLAYIDSRHVFHDTGILFAAYVNEDSPLISKILREALNTRIVNCFVGYQRRTPSSVRRQVYALWNALQRRNFKYSSISTTSLSSNIVYSQKVRTIEDCLDDAQINCVDGTVLFSSLLRAINLDPILVRVPGHMFIGYYLDRKHTQKEFLETTMVGDVNLDDFFPDQKLDSTMQGKSQNEMSKITFEKAQLYATNNFTKYEKLLSVHRRFYLFLTISKKVRKDIQPIGK